jgi:glycosyltransferase involved in cell wall biosynthesis
LLFALWAFLLIPLWLIITCWRLKRLATRLPAPETWPVVSVVVPARDEGQKIEQALSSLLAIDYPILEIIAIDDRSQDTTGEVMDRLAARDARLRVIHVTKLPAGWLGKNHAMHRGAQAARGEWLLFTDGDVLFAPETLRLAISYAEQHRIDHLCMNPGLVSGGYWEDALTTCFGMLFFTAFQVWLISTRWTGAYCGVGAFNLVRAAVYADVGGFERLRMDVLDDVYLGRIVKRAGYRQQLLVGDDLIRVRWQGSFRGVIRGLEKNSFASLHYSIRELISSTLLLSILCFTPYAGLFFWQQPAAWGLVGSVALMHATYGYIAARSGNGLRVAPALPVMLLTFIYVLWRSAVITLRQRGVRWRDTFYPLDELRRNQLR